LENKFAPLNLSLPLDSDYRQALAKVKKVTKEMKSEFSIVYATYILSIVCGLLMPCFVMRNLGD